MKHIRLVATTPICGLGRPRQKRTVRSRFALACLTGALTCAGATPAHAVSGNSEDGEGIVIVSDGSPVRIYCNTDAAFQPPPPAGPQELFPTCHQRSLTSGFFPNDEGLAFTFPQHESSTNIVLNRGQTLVENVTISAQTFGQFTVSNAGPLAVSTPVEDSEDLAEPPPHAVSLICATFDDDESAAVRQCVKVIENIAGDGEPLNCGGLQVEADEDDCAGEIADLENAFSDPKANWILEIPEPSLVGDANSVKVKVCVVNASWECADTQNLDISGSVQGQGVNSVVFTPHCVRNVCSH